MTEGFIVKARKALDDDRVAVHAVYDDASVATHTTIRGAIRYPGCDNLWLGCLKS